jgi:hypothetical protein
MKPTLFAGGGAFPHVPHLAVRHHVDNGGVLRYRRRSARHGAFDQRGVIPFGLLSAHDGDTRDCRESNDPENDSVHVPPPEMEIRPPPITWQSTPRRNLTISTDDGNHQAGPARPL